MHAPNTSSSLRRRRVLLAWLAIPLVGIPAVHQLWADAVSKPVVDVGTAASEPVPRFPVTIRAAREPSGVTTGTLDAQGREVTVKCATCHGQQPVRTNVRTGTDLTRFHQGLKMNHATLSCVSCHNPADGYATLRLADGTAVPFSDTMTMCAQCHGNQFRDYQHGSHGGMTGHWDLTRGPRQRNHCVDCHDPHAPQFPVVKPAPGPADRFPPQPQK